VTVSVGRSVGLSGVLWNDTFGAVGRVGQRMTFSVGWDPNWKGQISERGIGQAGAAQCNI